MESWRHLLRLFALTVACATGQALADGAPRFEVTLTAAGYAGAVVSNFPVLVSVSMADISGFDYSDCQADGSDLNFVQDGLTCPCDIDTWNTNGTTLVWVLLTELKPGATFKMRYGGDSLASTASDVWRSPKRPFVGVWHMNEASGNVTDATGNGHTAVPTGSGCSSQSVRTPGGAVGSARLNGSADHVQGASSSYLSLADSANLSLGGRFTVSGWAKPTANGDYWPRFMSNKTSSTDAFGFEIHGSSAVGGIVVRGAVGSEYLLTTTSWSKGVWKHLAFVYEGETYTAYVNGVNVGSKTVSGGAVTDSAYPVSIASNANGSEWAFYGALDEMRLLSGSVSADYVAAEYATVAQGGFLTASSVSPITEGTIVASLSGCTAYEDGAAHGPTLTVTYPTSGYEVVWSADGGAYSETCPAFTTAGTHEVRCRISCSGFETVERAATVAILLRDISATALDVAVDEDGAAHLIDVTVTEPSSGVTREWSTDGGATYAGEAPAITKAGVYALYCRLSKEHYASKVVGATLTIRTSLTYVSPTGVATVPYATPETAARTVEDAYALVADGGRIRVLAGEYSREQSDIARVSRHVRIEGPADRSAVFVGDLADYGSHRIILLEGASVSGVTFRNFYIALESDVDATISNCLFTSCKYPVALCGLLCDCDFRNCAPAGDPCAMVVRIETSDTLISRCTFTGGSVSASGIEAGAVVRADVGMAVRIEDTTFAYNTNTALYGSLVWNEDSKAALTRCRFVGNISRSFVRLSRMGDSRQPLAATNCLFAANESLIPADRTTRFAALFCYGEAVNCTFVGNKFQTLVSVNSDDFINTGKRMSFVNCIVQDNTVDGGTWEDAVTGVWDGSFHSISHSLYPDATGTGNIATPASFALVGRDPFRLRAGSPGVDAGAPLGWTRADRDLQGLPRLGGSGVDMGCYERPGPGTQIRCE